MLTGKNRIHIAYCPACDAFISAGEITTGILVSRSREYTWTACAICGSSVRTDINQTEGEKPPGGREPSAA